MCWSSRLHTYILPVTLQRSSKPLCQVEGRIDELSKSKKPKYDVYVPMAEQLMKFHKRTPPRFRTKRPNTPGANREPHICHELTKPKTPKLITKARSRSIRVESAAEKEEKEVKEVKRYVDTQSVHCLM